MKKYLVIILIIGLLIGFGIGYATKKCEIIYDLNQDGVVDVGDVSVLFYYFTK